MPISEQYIADVDVDNEPDESKVAAKIASDVKQSITYWQEFKDLSTELYFDFLAYKESISDKTKSNTFIPLSYVDVVINKGRIKKAITASTPIGKIKTIPYNPLQSHKLSQFAQILLNEAKFKQFLDLLLQDALIYTGAVFQVTWGTQHKMQPALVELNIVPGQSIFFPKFDELGQRAFELQEIRDGIFLENVHIHDFLLPEHAESDEDSWAWAGKFYRKHILQLQSAINPDGTPYYSNMDKLKEMGASRRSETSEKTRQYLPLKRDYPSAKEGYFDIIEYCTDNSIIHMPDGADFLIRRERNPYRKKPYHIARVQSLTGEAFGFSPNRANHLMTRTYNEIVDIVMDGLFLEDNKCWIVNEELVSDFELRAQQDNIIHVHGLDAGMDVQSAVRVIETRALASEVLALLQMFDSLHQLVGMRPNMAAGVAQTGAETAFENAALMEGASTPVMDMMDNIVQTALEPIYEDLIHLARINFLTKKGVDVVDHKGEIAEHLDIFPQDLIGKFSVEFEFVGRERSKIEERAALTNLLMVWGNVQNVDEVSALLMENLLVNSGIPDMNRINSALQAAIQQRRMMEQMALQAKLAPPSGEGGGGMPGGGPVHEAMVPSANQLNFVKPSGI